MSQYYFLVASLPLLTYDDEAELSSEQFLEIIKTNLHPADSATVAAASIEAPRTVDGASVSERMWRTYDRGLRNVLARSRAPQRNTDANHYIRTDELLHDETQRAGLEELAREATLAPSPLSAEDLLNRARWRELENLEVGHNFDVQYLVVYYLKLQLLERRGLFNRDDGEAAFLSVTESSMNDYYRGPGET